QVRVRRDHALRVFLIAALTFVLLVGPALTFQFLGPQAVYGRAHGPNYWVSDLLGFIVPTKLQWLTLPLALSLRDRLPATLYEFLVAWAAMAQAPVLSNILPVRLTLFVFLLAGVLLAFFVDHLVRAQAWRPRLLAAAVAILVLAPLFPRVPYPATLVEVPAF